MPDMAVVFQAAADFARACRALDAAGAAYRVVEPPAAVADVAVPFVVLPDASRGALHEAVRGGLVLAGHVPYRETAADAVASVPPAPEGAEDVVGRLVIAFVALCTATDDALRLTVQVEGDLGPVLPYLNAAMPAGTFGPEGPTFTFMDGPRLVSLSPHRIGVARARDMVDAWAVLARIKRTVLDVWSRRATIAPSTERRVQISVLEVYARLPQINCGACGEATCLAFAAKVLAGEGRLGRCKPAFEGGHRHLRDALVDLAAALGRPEPTGGPEPSDRP